MFLMGTFRGIEDGSCLARLRCPFWWVCLFSLKISRGQMPQLVVYLVFVTDGVSVNIFLLHNPVTFGMHFRSGAPQPGCACIFHRVFLEHQRRNLHENSDLRSLYIYIYTYVCVKCGAFTVSLTNKIAQRWLGHAAMPVTILQG